jgi:hypothetical protein
MPRLNLIERPQPFLGMLLAGGGWALSHQVGNYSAFDSCPTGGLVTVVASLIGLAITAGGGFYCLLAWRKAEGSGRSVAGAIGMLLALICGFAIVLQIAAGLILPQCAA